MTTSAAGDAAMATDVSAVPGAGLPLVDHHCHGVVRGELGRDAFELLMTEAGTPAPAGTTHFDTPVGLAIRRWCAPVLDLGPHTSPDTYVARRAELGGPEVNRRFLSRAGIGRFLVDTGYAAADLLTPEELAHSGGGAAGHVVRLEAVAEQVAASAPAAASYADRFGVELARQAAGAVGLKSIIAYRYGLDIAPEPPRAAEVTEAAGRWLAAPDPPRLAEPVLLRHALWAGVEVARERGLPLQFHTGYGDPDLDLHRCDPALLTGFIRAVRSYGVPVMLLHCYPYHRQAAYLAAAYPHVYVDVGLALTYTAASSGTVIAEMMELAPFHKQLFSSDAFGLAEFFYLGAMFYRRGLGAVLARWVERGECGAADAERIAALIGAENARRVYDLPG